MKNFFNFKVYQTQIMFSSFIIVFFGEIICFISGSRPESIIGNIFVFLGFSLFLFFLIRYLIKIFVKEKRANLPAVFIVSFLLAYLLYAEYNMIHSILNHYNSFGFPGFMWQRHNFWNEIDKVNLIVLASVFLIIIFNYYYYIKIKKQ